MLLWASLEYYNNRQNEENFNKTLFTNLGKKNPGNQGWQMHAAPVRLVNQTSLWINGKVPGFKIV